MTKEQAIEKMTNEQKVEALAKFIALKSLNINKAIEYGNMLDDLLETIQDQQAEIEKKDKKIELMAESIANDNELNHEVCENVYYYNTNCIEKDKTKEMCRECIKQYFERKVENGSTENM